MGSILPWMHRKGMAETYRYVLKNPKAWRIIHTRTLDTNYNQTAVAILYHSVETMQCGSTWH
jgi:hypothetical protein